MPASALGPIAAALSFQVGFWFQSQVIEPIEGRREGQKGSGGLGKGRDSPSDPGSYSKPKVEYPAPSYDVSSVRVITEADSWLTEPCQMSTRGETGQRAPSRLRGEGPTLEGDRVVVHDRLGRRILPGVARVDGSELRGSERSAKSRRAGKLKPT